MGLGGRAFQAKETGPSKALRQESHWQVGKGKTNELGMVSQRENGRRRGREVVRGRLTQGTEPLRGLRIGQISRRVTRSDLHFSKVTLAALWKLGDQLVKKNT